jgi:hypothetical protein
LLQAATAGAKVSKDITPLITALRKPQRVISPEREKAAYVALENARGNKELEAGVRADYADVLGEPQILKDYKNKLAGQNGGAQYNGQNGAIPVGDLSSKTNKELELLARKPKGVSSDEANQAQAELDARRNHPDRMSAF